MRVVKVIGTIWIVIYKITLNKKWCPPSPLTWVLAISQVDDKTTENITQPYWPSKAEWVNECHLTVCSAPCFPTWGLCALYFSAGRRQTERRKKKCLCLVDHWYQNNHFVSGSGTQAWEMSNQKGCATSKQKMFSHKRQKHCSTTALFIDENREVHVCILWDHVIDKAFFFREM